jgi:hypothetical protein
MKRYLIVAMVAIGAACSDDFLEKPPIDSKVEENFYQTPQDAFEGLVAVYDGLQIDYDGFRNYVLNAEIVSDNCFAGGGTGDNEAGPRIDRFERHFDQYGPVWKKYYTAIYRANLLLSKLDAVEWGDDDALKARYEAEAKFLRAYFYFDLARMFGHIPLVTTPLNADEYYVLQAEAPVVYAQIAEDLKTAIENLEEVPYEQMPQSEYGRVTKWAAQALLGRVFLFYTNYYGANDLAGVFTRQQVRDYIDDVIANSGHELVDDFSSLWLAASASADVDYAGENNEETVWAIKYTYKGYGNGDMMDGSRWQVMVGLRSQTHVPYANGWGAATVNPDLWAAYNANDKRRSASIISVDDESFSITSDDQRQYTGYYWKKFAPYANPDGSHSTTELGGDYQLDNYEDYPALRFSDVLLMGAELHLDGGDLAKAEEYFDQVRKRAFGVFDGTIDEATFDANYDLDLSGGDAKELIMEERRLELALEGHRYWDLIRQGMVVAEQALDNLTGDEFYVDFRPQTGGFFAIPETQINLSRSTLEQNDGWK